MVKVQNSTRRKLAIASWRPPREGNIYGKLTLDVTEVNAYLADVRERTGERVTITHFVGRVVAEALAKSPSLNGYIRFGKYRQHDQVAVSYLVALEEGADLAQAKVDAADQKTVAETAAALRERADRLRQGMDNDFEASKGLINAMPTWILRRLVWLTGFLSSSLGASIPAAGIRAFPFGSAIITSIGMFGLDEGFVPQTPFTRVPLYVLIGGIKDVVAIEDGDLVVRQELTLTATVDHRFMDGFQGGVLAREVRRLFADPWSLEEAPAAGS